MCLQFPSLIFTWHLTVESVLRGRGTIEQGVDLSCKPFRNCLSFECSQKNSHSCTRALFMGVQLNIFHLSGCPTLVSSFYRKWVQHLWRYHDNNYCHLCLTSMIKDIDHVLDYWGNIPRYPTLMLNSTIHKENVQQFTVSFSI